MYRTKFSGMNYTTRDVTNFQTRDLSSASHCLAVIINNHDNDNYDNYRVNDYIEKFQWY